MIRFHAQKVIASRWLRVVLGVVVLAAVVVGAWSGWLGPVEVAVLSPVLTGVSISLVWWICGITAYWLAEAILALQTAVALPLDTERRSIDVSWSRCLLLGPVALIDVINAAQFTMHTSAQEIEHRAETKMKVVADAEARFNAIVDEMETEEEIERRQRDEERDFDEWRSVQTDVIGQMTAQAIYDAKREGDLTQKMAQALFDGKWDGSPVEVVNGDVESALKVKAADKPIV